MLFRDTVKHAVESALHQRPEALNRVRVDIPTHVDTLGVTHTAMVVAGLPKVTVADPFICVDDRRGQDALLNVRQQCCGFRIGNRHRGHAALALHHPKHGLLGRIYTRTAAMVAVSRFPSDVGFINLDRRSALERFGSLLRPAVLYHESDRHRPRAPSRARKGHSMTTITQQHAEKLIDVLSHGLVSGLGHAEPGKFCVEAAVCYALGLPHGDDPGCVSAPLRRLKIGLNDQHWSSPQARAKGLQRLALAQLGSKGVLDDKEFVRRVCEMTIRTTVPNALRAAATVNPKHADALEAAAVRCEVEGTRDSARNGERVALASVAAAANSANAAAAAAAYAEVAAAYAEVAAVSAEVAANAAAYAVSAAVDAASTRDRVLAHYAEQVVQILSAMDAPGCQWLHLAPLEAAV